MRLFTLTFHSGEFTVTIHVMKHRKNDLRISKFITRKTGADYITPEEVRKFRYNI